MATGIALVLLAEGAAGEPLDAAACDVLTGERATLVAAGLKADMEKGPEWGKANLAADRLQQIAKLIDIEEQLLFRCPQPKAPPAEKEAGKKAPGKGKDTGKAKAVAQPGAPSADTAGEAGGAAGATDAGITERDKAEKKKPQAKPKPEATDVYTPPPPAMGYEPSSTPQ